MAHEKPGPVVPIGVCISLLSEEDILRRSAPATRPDIGYCFVDQMKREGAEYRERHPFVPPLPGWQKP
jgi:hypothetical protein